MIFAPKQIAALQSFFFSLPLSGVLLCSAIPQHTMDSGVLVHIHCTYAVGFGPAKIMAAKSDSHFFFLSVLLDPSGPPEGDNGIAKKMARRTRISRPELNDD